MVIKMKVWENNLDILALKNKSMSEEIRRVIEQEEIDNVFSKELENGNVILGVHKAGRSWYLNSKLDPEGASGIYADRYQVKPFYRYLVFGFGDGRVVRNLLRKCDDSNRIIICEPDKHIFAEAVKQYDLSDILDDDRVWIGLSDMWETMYSIIFSLIEYSYIECTEYCILPGYDVLYTDICKKFMDEIIDRIRSLIVHKNTCFGFNRMIPRNILFNIKNMIGQRNLGQVKEKLKDVNFDKIPAIIICAGPSLDKNIKEIKRAEGKAFIFVVDAALRTVIQEGIQPDLVCTIDPQAPRRFYENVDKNSIICSCNEWANPEILVNYGEKVFYHNGFTAWWDNVIQSELDYEFPIIESGGCVSAEALQLARYLGFKTIIFVGQDLAFTGGVSHTKGIEGILGENEDYINNRHLVKVEDAEGNLLDTDFQMWYYKLWFDKIIQRNQEEIRVIDATEGGAKIAGTVIQTLKKTIDMECHGNLNAYDMIRDIPPAFEKEQQGRLFEKIYGIKEEMEDFENELAKEIEQGELIKDAVKKGILGNDEIIAMVESFMKQSQIIDKHLLMEWITMYAKKDEFDLQDDIYVKEDMGLDEIIDRSIRLFQSYQKAVPLFNEDFCAVFD